MKKENTNQIPKPNYDGSFPFIFKQADGIEIEIAVVGDFIRENIVQAYLLTKYTQEELDELRAISYKKKKSESQAEQLKELDALKDDVNNAIDEQYGKDF